MIKETGGEFVLKTCSFFIYNATAILRFALLSGQITQFDPKSIK